MWRSTLPNGRKGFAIKALSAIDIAIWDALAKERQEPLYNLLGGKTKEKIPCYTTSPDVVNPPGFAGYKFCIPYGPAHGDEGLRKNVEFIKKQRDLAGPDTPLMLDCYMALNVPYVIKLMHSLKGLGIKWVEDCLQPDDYDGWKTIRERTRDTGILLTTGENEYLRFGYKKFLRDGSIDVLQPDVTWVGGVTELRRVIAMASAYDIPVIPHSCTPYSIHFAAAYPNVPMVEYLNLSPKGDTIVPVFGSTFEAEPLPENGEISLPDTPGFGLTPNFKVLDLHRPYPRDN